MSAVNGYCVLVDLALRQAGPQSVVIKETIPFAELAQEGIPTAAQLLTRYETMPQGSMSIEPDDSRRHTLIWSVKRNIEMPKVVG